MKQLNCKNCENPLAKLKDKTLEIFNKRVSEVGVDFVNQSTSVKCRTCGYYSNVSMTGNELDIKKTSKSWL